MPTGGQWAVGIGSGAATGAATGSTFGPWGTLIGGVVGAGAGALATGLQGNAAEEERRRALQSIEQDTTARKRDYLIGLLRAQAGAAGIPTVGLDVKLAQRGFDTGPARAAVENAYQQSQQLSPQAFVPIVQGLGMAAANTYRGLNQPAAAMPQAQAPAPQNAGMQEPYYLRPNRYSLTGGFR